MFKLAVTNYYSCQDLPRLLSRGLDCMLLSTIERFRLPIERIRGDDVPTRDSVTGFARPSGP